MERTPYGVRTPSGEYLPARRLSEYTETELDNWPTSKARPWPVDHSELTHERFGLTHSRVGVEVAESVKGRIGRYPNEDEFRYIMAHRSDERSLAPALEAMRRSPLSHDALTDMRRVGTRGTGAESVFCDPRFERDAGRVARGAVRDISQGRDPSARIGRSVARTEERTAERAVGNVAENVVRSVLGGR